MTLEGSAALQADHHIPCPIVGEVAGAADEAITLLAVVISEPKHPELGVEEVTRARCLHLVDHGFEEGQEIVALGGHRHVPGLAEDVDAVGVVADRLQDAERVGRRAEVGASKSQRHG